MFISLCNILAKGVYPLDNYFCDYWQSCKQASDLWIRLLDLVRSQFDLSYGRW